MLLNNLHCVGRPVPKAIIRQFRLRESREYKEALAKSGKKKMDILWAGIKQTRNEVNAYEHAFIFS